ncbi:MAG: Panacea domain-containing protein [Tepidisphaeraceae bacterium]
MRFSPLEYARIVEASAFLVKQSPGQTTTKLPLLKLLYLADRESIRQTGQSITGDAPAAMEHGPILKCAYDMMKNPSAYPLWKKHLDSSKEKKEVTLTDDPGADHLSKLDIAILTKVWSEFGHLSAAQLRQYTHDLPEYLKNEPETKTSNDIPLADLLQALGQSDRLEKIEREAAQIRAAHRKFSEYSR